jgi:ferredoxin--NADP+ reductase
MRVEKHEIPAAGSVYRPAHPFQVVVLSNTQLTEPESPDDIRQLVLCHEGRNIQYVEGQSVGVIAPGERAPGKPHRPRIYSVASSRVGDDLRGTTLTLCVKRVRFVDQQTGKEVVGVASNYLCDLQPGDTVNMTGPVGRRFLLPADDRTDLVMIAVGTGIAPFRAFIHYIYRVRQSWRGRVRLFYGSKTGMESLFMNRENDDIGLYMQQETFRAFRALSDVETEHQHQGLVQDRLQENAHEIWSIMRERNFCLYLCGLRAVEQGAQEVLGRIAAQHGHDWDALLQEYRAEGRWNVEVY